MAKDCGCGQSIDCGCPIKDLSTDCVLYTGDGLENLGVEQNTILTYILSTLDEEVPYFRGGIKHKGEYISGEMYRKNDVVEIDGSSYISLVNNNTENPIGSNLWELMVSKGDKGDKGDTGDFEILQFMVNNDMDLIMQYTGVESPYDFEMNDNGQLIINI